MTRFFYLGLDAKFTVLRRQPKNNKNDYQSRTVTVFFIPVSGATKLLTFDIKLGPKPVTLVRFRLMMNVYEGSRMIVATTLV